MIVSFNKPRVAGEIIRRGIFWDDKGRRADDHPVLIIRPATYEEWAKEVIEDGNDPAKELRNIQYLYGDDPVYFYEITTD